METIQLHTKSRPSTVLCGAGALSEAKSFLQGKECFVVTDSNVLRLYADTISQTFPGARVCAVPRRRA